MRVRAFLFLLEVGKGAKVRAKVQAKVSGIRIDLLLELLSQP